MHIMLMVLIGITTTQPAILDQTDEEWTAPGYRIVEEVSINPLDYGEPISWGENCNGPTASIGCQAFFIPTEDGEKWRIIILLKDKLVVLQEDEEVRDIPLTCNPWSVIYSRNGKYVLVLGSVLEGSRDAIYSVEAEHVNIETGEVRTFQPLQNTGWTGMQFVNDDGSIYRWDYTASNQLEYYDSDLNRMYAREINIGWGSRWAHASGGSIIAFLEIGNILTVYDKTGELLWERELDVDLPSNPLVSANGSVVLLATSSGLECYDGFTGEFLWEEFDTRASSPVPSVFGYAWVAALRGSGLALGSNAESRESIIDIKYPAEAWTHGGPYAVAANGAFIAGSASKPPKYLNNHLRKILYFNCEGEILWMSSIFSIASNSLTLDRSNNSELELGIGSNIQSDGKRFIYSDSNQILIMHVEEGDI